MRRVDFLGGPGVGKTYLFERLSRDGSQKFQTSREAKVAAVCMILGQRRSLRNGLLLSVLRFPLPLSLKLALSRPVFDHHGNALFLQDVTHERFAQRVIELCSSDAMPTMHRMLAIERLFRHLRDTIALETILPKQGMIVADESLSHKIYEVVPGYGDNFEERATAYFEHMPAPSGLCHFYCDLEMTLRRVRKRSATTQKIVWFHRVHDESVVKDVITRQAKIARIGRDILARRGVKVLDVDTTEPAETSLRRMSNFLQHFSYDDEKIGADTASRPWKGEKA